MSKRFLFVSSTYLLVVAGLAGCVTKDVDDGASPREPASDDEGWTDALVVRMDEPGAVLVPFYASEAATVQSGRMWLDGGSWRGYHFDLLDDHGTQMERWGGALERHERAERVYENRRDGEYEIECLGEREGDFCALFNNTDRVEPTMVGEDYIFRNGHALPPGFHYFVVHAVFETRFQVNFDLDQPIWVGQPVDAGAAVRFGPENFRGEYLDAVRCAMILWCGAVVDASFPISGEGDLALIKLQATNIGAAYADACITEASGQRYCQLVPAASGPSIVYNVREVIPMDAQPTITATMAGGPPLKDWTNALAGSWWLGGWYVTFSLPDEHPGHNAA